MNSKDYNSSDWRLKRECEFFTNRKLCSNELVADFDKIADIETAIFELKEWFVKHNFLFWLYQSSGDGIHIHFFVDGISTKFQKKELLILIEKQLNADGVDYKIDKNPVQSGRIRAEDSIHPRKLFKKQLIYTNVDSNAYLGEIFYFNELTHSTYKKVSKYSTTDAQNDNLHNGNKQKIEDDIKNPLTIKTMLESKFVDGRKRVLFCLVSFWHNTLTPEAIYDRVIDWCRSQNYKLSEIEIKATINASQGLVRDRYRQELLEELGIKIKKNEEVIYNEF